MLQMERDAALKNQTTEMAAFNAVSSALWMQREALQTLLYRLTCEQLVLTSGSSRWLARADDEVRSAIDQLRTGEVLRAAEVDQLAVQLGLDADASLAELAEASPEPWGTLFADHRTALRALAFEVQGVADENRRLLDSGAKAVAETLAELSNIVTRYDARGRAVQGQPRSMLLDEQA
jgi:FlgN protein